jgi:DHA1 family tetracycline resistance protein-like MFS transporter
MQPDSGLLPATATTAHRTTVLGILLALYPVGQFFGTPVLSSLSDRYGRRRVLLPSIAATTLCYGLIATSLGLHSLALLSASLLLAGLGEANCAIAQSAIADVSPPADRGRLFGYVFVAVRLGYVVGPLIGGQIVERTGNYALPFWLVVGLLAATLVWVHLRFRETHAPEPGRAAGIGAAFANMLTIFTDRRLRPLYALNFILYVAIFGFSRTVLMYLVDHWHMGPGEITTFYAYYAASVAIANLWLMPLLEPRVALRTIAWTSAVTGGLGTIWIALPTSKFWLWVALGPAPCLLSLCVCATAALLANAATPEQEGSVMGNNEALEVAGQAAGAAGGGSLAAIRVDLPLYVYGGLVMAGALLLARYRPPAAGKT